MRASVRKEMDEFAFVDLVFPLFPIVRYTHKVRRHARDVHWSRDLIAAFVLLCLLVVLPASLALQQESQWPHCPSWLVALAILVIWPLGPMYLLFLFVSGLKAPAQNVDFPASWLPASFRDSQC